MYTYSNLICYQFELVSHVCPIGTVSSFITLAFQHPRCVRRVHSWLNNTFLELNPFALIYITAVFVPRYHTNAGQQRGTEVLLSLEEVQMKCLGPPGVEMASQKQQGS